ncbi:MAG: cobalamin biosynthesis protein, partial [Alphaproteobacteria bacterium]
MNDTIPAFVSGIDGRLWVALAAMAVNLLFWRAKLLERAFASPLALGTRLLDILERRYNRPELSEKERRAEGISVLVLVVAVALVAGIGIGYLARLLPYGWWLEALCLSVLITQRQGFDEMRVLCRSLRRSSSEARATLAMIGQRDVEDLDDSHITRAGAEILALGFNRGVMAVLFYMLLGGLPLAFLFKIVNVADWMAGTKTRDGQG